MKLKTIITLLMVLLLTGITALSVSAARQTHHGIGTVTAIDNKAKKIELKHGPIKSIGWMGMKMFFAVEDAELLDEVEVGDKVDFDFIETRDKRYVITDIEAQ
ncbi:MAG: copper-binding protein [Gammaproteobacteria bacterium]|nr:copper-binding protein [Gammaproteobacteria bacterium]MCF6261604.1 copper-binding protein [Gammaproteobacteria bacterium]